MASERGCETALRNRLEQREGETGSHGRNDGSPAQQRLIGGPRETQLREAGRRALQIDGRPAHDGDIGSIPNALHPPGCPARCPKDQLEAVIGRV